MPGNPRDAKLDRAERITYVAEKMRLTSKQAKRRVRKYEAWQRNVGRGLVGTCDCCCGHQRHPLDFRERHCSAPHSHTLG